MPNRESVVVATDFSDAAQRATDEAVELARQLELDVVLVHAYELPLYGFPDGAWLASAEAAAHRSIVSQRLLDDELARCRDRGVGVRGEVRLGAPWREVTDVARELRARFIVVGTSGRSGVPRLLLGSVAERVLRSADRPVLVVHAGAPAAPETGGRR